MGEFLHKSRQGSNNHQNFHQSQQTQLKPLENKVEAKPEEDVSNETLEAVFQRKRDRFGGDDESRNQRRGPVPPMVMQDEEELVQHSGPVPSLSAKEIKVYSKRCNIYLLVLLLLICEACCKSKSISHHKSIDPIQSFFVDVSDSIFTCYGMKSNFNTYGINISNKEDRGRIFSTNLVHWDTIISNNDHIIISLYNTDIQSKIDLRLLNKRTKTYSIISKCYAPLWDENTFRIYRYKKALLVECTKDVMPEITLSDFIKPSCKDLFTQDYINNPYLVYTYQNERNDTLNVRFEPEDHPFFWRIWLLILF